MKWHQLEKCQFKKIKNFLHRKSSPESKNMRTKMSTIFHQIIILKTNQPQKLLSANYFIASTNRLTSIL